MKIVKGVYVFTAAQSLNGKFESILSLMSNVPVGVLHFKAVGKVWLIIAQEHLHCTFHAHAGWFTAHILLKQIKENTNKQIIAYYKPWWDTIFPWGHAEGVEVFGKIGHMNMQALQAQDHHGTVVRDEDQWRGFIMDTWTRHVGHVCFFHSHCSMHWNTPWNLLLPAPDPFFRQAITSGGYGLSILTPGCHLPTWCYTVSTCTMRSILTPTLSCKDNSVMSADHCEMQEWRSSCTFGF